MATLLELCALPTAWVEREERKERSMEIGLSKKLAWKQAKLAQRERMKAYREREQRRAMRNGVHGTSLESDRRRVCQTTLPEPIRKETQSEIFFAGQGVRQPKKAKNKAASEQMGTIGRRVVVKRFDGSRLTCVCKSRVY